MSKGKVVIIGSGLGGLSCGVILAKNGYEVSVYEQSSQIGGCLQCFTRRGVRFETGMHFIGSADPGQPLYKLMKYTGISGKISLSRLDESGYDVISIGGNRFRYANGKDAFIAELGSQFPHEKNNLHKYFEIVEKVAEASALHSLSVDNSDASIATEYQLRSVNEVVASTIKDPLLAKVLVGNLPLYAGEKDKTPFSTHAFIMDFYNRSSFRVIGGSDAIATALADELMRFGGKIFRNSRVNRIICNETKATGIEVNAADFIPADYVVSAIHPLRTLDLVGSKLLRPAFRSRIAAIPQTAGGFSVYIHFKDKTMPYMNSNFYGYNYESPWDCEKYTDFDWPKGYLYMHFCDETDQKWARGGVILSYMHFNEVAKWTGTQIGKRGNDYEAFKTVKAEKLIDSVSREIPTLRNSISHYYTSTPLTYRDYTGTESGSMYGICKDISSGGAYRVPHRTKIPNLLLTGQNINSHGMLGVLVGSIVTCSEFLSAPEIYRQINEANNETE